MLGRAQTAVIAGLVWCLTAQISIASPQGDHLARVLRLNEIVAIMHDEGAVYGDDLNTDMLDGTGGQYWASTVARIYDTDRMEATLRQAIADTMTPEQIAKSVGFFETDNGQRILTLETSARAAMFDPEIEEVARQNYRDLAEGEDARLAAVTRFVAANDLLDMNVAGALTSNYQFYRGLVDGEALTLSEDEILADVWGQEQEIREDTQAWLFGFLLMAYRPLSDDDLEAYIAFSGSEAGKALNQSLFEGFDIMYNAISYQLGRSVARAMQSSDL